MIKTTLFAFFPSS